MPADGRWDLILRLEVTSHEDLCTCLAICRWGLLRRRNVTGKLV